jgi:SNF2 family DNA or RNA helicase
MDQWEEQIEIYKPGLFVRKVLRHSPDTPDQGVYIMAYNSIQTGGRKSLSWVWATPWHTVIYDEAHRLRNQKSQQFKNARDIPASHNYFLTGTPMENNPSDIWALLHLCDRKAYKSKHNFIDIWCETTVTPWKIEVKGVHPHLIERFNEEVNQYMLRRKKTDHLDLPPVINSVIKVPLPPELLKLHRRAKQEFRIDHPDLEDPQLALSAGALVPMLRQLVGDPPKGIPNNKTAMICNLMEDLPPQPYIVFTWHRACAERVVQDLEDADKTTYLIHGGIRPEDRLAVIDEWRQDPHGILVGTLSCIGEGMNLQHAATVFFYEHSYLPGAQEQAVARIQRIGQTSDTLLAYHVLGQYSADESVYRVAQGRHTNIARALLEDILDQEEPGV